MGDEWLTQEAPTRDRGTEGRLKELTLPMIRNPELIRPSSLPPAEGVLKMSPSARVRYPPRVSLIP